MPINNSFPPVVPGPFYDAEPAYQGPPRTKRTVRAYQYTGATVPPDSVSQFDLSRFVWLNGTKVFSYAAASQKIVDAPAGENIYRQYLSIRNDSATQTLYVDFGQDASLLSGIALLPGEVIAYDAVIPQDDVYVFGSGAGSVSVLYGNTTLPV